MNKKAQHNYDFYTHLSKDKTKFTEWQVTSAFYVALHLVKDQIFPAKISIKGKLKLFKNFEEYCRKNQKHISHSELAKIIKQKMNPIYEDYKELQDMSWDARYSPLADEYDPLLLSHVESMLGRIMDACK